MVEEEGKVVLDRRKRSCRGEGKSGGCWGG